MADVDEEEEDFVYPLSLKICWTVVFATTAVASILISLYIVVKWRKLSKHQSYLIFFVWTLFGSALIQFDRLTDMWGWLSWDYWSWGFYAFGQNLLVAPELEEAYGQAALHWEYVDVISNAVFTLIVFRVWYKHIRIMWIRDFGDGFPSHTSASDYFNTDTGMGNTIQSGFNNGLRRISNAGIYVVGTVSGTMRRRATTTNLKSTDDTIVENPNSLSHDRALTIAIGGVRARAMTSMCMTHNTVMPEDALIEEADEDFNKERRWSRLSKCLSHPSRSSQQYEVNQFRDLDFDAFTAAPTSSVGTFLGESIRSIGRRLSTTRQLSMRSLRSTTLEGTQNANPDRRAQSLPDIL
ncbi:hypothetical protein SARC_07018 [Sphaeroforma arctica JP610]|uniref:Uncharacterized protein n=1 Tax=Sphaeroforma arctica JP610 TaxID=667725 RepID=A0A0L0FUX8_9EUKA|nr:hypothetical protein SARC_07018 [Sphaeroforma arctica JP610]KNC80627.1 hypothetical protein SARC_07018 [Sphaeroforma arctica JP610]|eukprot:XP_014154529.1 hypothetical protein SARC_07018 [Sphaeroforma arctica JP610]